MTMTTTTTNPQPATTTPTPSTNLEENKKTLEGRAKFAQGLTEVEEELKKAEYNDLGTLTDLVTKYFTISTSKAWGDIQKTVEEIKGFTSKNVKPKTGKTQLELSNIVEAGVLKAEGEAKGKNLDEPANGWIKEYTAALTTARNELKKGEYNNLETLGTILDAVNKGWDGKAADDIKKQHEALNAYFKDNLKK